MTEYKLNSTLREDFKRSTTRQLRREGKIPAVYYHHHEKPIHLAVDLKELRNALHSGAHIFDLSLGKKSHKAILRDLQHDPLTDEIIHADFMGVALDEFITIKVPVHITGIAIGVKTFGGVLEQHLWDLEVKCKTIDIPEAVTIDVTNLNIGDAIKAGDLKLEKIEILTPTSASIVSVVQPTGAKVEEAKPEEEAAITAETSTAAEPEK
jgi:large subunit ribosomal protein L25